ncbi:MAG: glycosyltransferase family 4 protein [Bacteroidota bacterium]|jgi:glycosyltransferase involved in cell wall biosynthesis
MRHVGFDAKRLFFNPSGLGNYSRSIVRALALHTDDLKLSLFSPKKKSNWQNDIAIEGLDDFSTLNHVQFVNKPLKPFWWRSFGMGKSAAELKVDVFHGLSNEIPFDLPKHIRSICTIHDLIFMDQPGNYPWLDRKVYLKKVSYAMKQSNVIVSTSEFTKDRLLYHFPGTTSRIEVIYQPIHPIFRSQYENPTEITDPYLIYHSGFNRRKNHITLLKSFESIRNSIQHKLVLAGVAGDTLNEVQDFIKNSGLENRVQVHINIGRQDLVRLLRNAVGFVYPSLMEGFGIPLAEAAACGLNAAVSDIPVFNELSRDGLLSFNPNDFHDLAMKMQQLVNLDESEKEKQTLARRRILQITDETSIAKQLRDLYFQQEN